MMSFRWVTLAVAVPAAVAAQGAELAYEGSFAVASGQYFFTERTTSWTLNSGLALSIGRWTARAGFPAYLQNTTLVSASARGLTPTGGSLAGKVAHAGTTGGRGSGRIDVPDESVVGYRAAAGDPVAQITWMAVNRSRVSLLVGGVVKAPLADTTDFGTGRWDAGAVVSILQRVGTTAFLGFDASYWYLGDPDGLDLRNPLGATVSAGRVLGARWLMNASVTAAQSSLRGYDGPVTIGVGLGRIARSRS